MYHKAGIGFKLMRAYLSNNEISDISALSDCTLLENVYLDDNLMVLISRYKTSRRLKSYRRKAMLLAI